jgi:hypothetical protein
MSKVISFILVLVLFFGPVINSFAAGPNDGKDGSGGEKMQSTLMYVLIGGLVVVFFMWMFIEIGIVEAPAPDNGIRMVSAEDETNSVNTEGKTILNVLNHVEGGVTPNKDIYVGLRFQY